MEAASHGEVNITVLRGSNLRGNKSDPFHHFVRVEFNGAVVGDSARRQDTAVGPGVALDYDLTCSFRCPGDTCSLDDMAHKPLILTVMEILPKERKQKEERTAVLGQAVVDLLPLLHGECSISSLVPLHPTPGSPLETVSLDNTQLPSLEVAVSVPTPLLSEAQRLASNLLTVTVETAFSVPEPTWRSSLLLHKRLCNFLSLPRLRFGICSATHVFVATHKLKITALHNPAQLLCICYAHVHITGVLFQKEEVLLFSEGQLKAGGEREAKDRPRRWSQAGSLAPGAQVFPGLVSTQEEDFLEDEEYGDLISREDREFCREAEAARKRVCWDTVRRCFLAPGGATRFVVSMPQCLSMSYRSMSLCCLNVVCSCQQCMLFQAQCSLLVSEPEQPISFHGVAYVDMGPLLYPGATRIRGTYRVQPFSESDLLAKAGRTVSVLKEQASRAAAGQGKPRLGSAAGSHKATPSKAAKETTRKLSASKLPVADTVADVEPQVNAEGQMYVDAKTYIVMEITLEKPLVPKRPPAELATKVMELIPPRPPPPHRPAGAEKEFHRQVTSVVGQVLDQYQKLFGAAFQPGSRPLDPGTQEHRQSQLLGELNYSGKYFALKEQMKGSVVRIVREKMLRTEAFSHPEQLQAFLSQLYVYLVDQMHVALNKTDDPQEEEGVLLVLDVSQLRHFAREAELNGDFQLAAQYYQERLVRGQTEPSHWLDYGTLYMRTGDHVKAEECFHRAVSLQQAHLPSLVMCGVLAEMGGRYQDAETYLEGATCCQPGSVVAWTLFGMFHQGQNNHFQAERCFMTAGRLSRGSPVGRGATHERREGTQGEGPKLEGPQLEGRKDEEQEERELMEEMGKKEQEEVRSESFKPERIGEETEREGKPDAEMAAAARPPTLACNTTQSAPPRLYMETAQFLLQNHALQMAQRALAQELLSLEGGLTTAYRLATAKLHMLSADYCSADAALQEALAHTCKEPEAWALLGHCSYLSGDRVKARRCYERCLDYQQQPADTHPIYLRLGSVYLQEGQFQSARTTYLHGCSSSPSCLTWLGLGIACYRLENLREAEDALTEANTLNNMNPEVWGYLALVSLKMGRRVEAEQSYKYAVKLNLQEEALLREIKELQDQLGFGDPSF
ncbi:Cilia- and flagella-associated protein 70 [Merluccius polli]|uniref:Cilia- and flagella-associated protein 70 n=1 Tax=Merluccius polli TaxID=89951 RepID=A0AA47N465_MERPO|nr:Cilia- and flagella-associated protein 70 [Merluccius polli]